MCTPSGYRTNGQLLQANRLDDAGVRRIVGAAHTDLRRQRPHSLHPRPRLGAHRVASSDGSANPYLAIAAALGAGIDGIKRSADPGAVGSQGRSSLPPTLLHAVEDLEGNAVVAGVLDAVGEGVAAYFANLKREEFFAYHSAVSPWEVDHYLTAF